MLKAITGLFTYTNVKKIVSTIGDIAGVVTLFTGVANVGFKINDAFSKHSANKAQLIDGTADTTDTNDCIETEIVENVDVITE